jgi:predicted AlkP superfamily phosphohydrolase/phosphomutase
MEQVYRAIDREIGEILEMVGEDTLCLVFAGHGMGPLYHASWNLPEILELLGYGSKPRSAGRRSSEAREARVNPWRALKMAIPGRVQYRIKGMLPRPVQDWLLFKWYAGGQNWRGARAFAVPNNDSVGAIRINLRGRDPEGRVQPGNEYWQVCRDIASALYELRDPATGSPVVRKVTLTHEEFEGPYLEQLPDLTVLWEQSFPWAGLQSERLGTLRLKGQDGRTGSHTSRGFLLAAGPGVEAGRELPGGSLYDIAPTVLEAAGVAQPADLDGRILPLREFEVSHTG